MNSYVDFNYYTEKFNGNLIPKDNFDNLAKKASRKISYYTFNRINKENITDEVMEATCSIAELLFEQENLKNKILDSDNPTKASETVGPWSVSYRDNSQYQDKQIKTNEELNKEIYQICKEYLLNTGLMYRGV